MTNVKLSPELVELFRKLKSAHARKTGKWISYNDLLLKTLPSPEEYEPEDGDEESEDEYESEEE